MKGILFKPEMIQAIIEGRKTQTRRVIKPQPPSNAEVCTCKRVKHIYIRKDPPPKAPTEPTCNVSVMKPRYQVGETVYIKEKWAYAMNPLPFKKQRIIYKASESDLSHWEEIIIGNWRSPMSLKAEDARYFIEITDVRAERLQEITPYDAEAEGFAKWGLEHNCSACETESHSFYGGLYHFKEIWNSINKEKWESSPWVWVYTFKRSNNV